MADNTFSITIDKFYSGYSPLAFNNSLTEFGASGHASQMLNVDVINGDYATQGPGLSTLTNGTEAGAVTELIRFIMDRAVSADVTYAMGTNKLHRLSSTAVSNGSGWPHTITGNTQGESAVYLKGSLYYFWNSLTAGEIGKYDLTLAGEDIRSYDTHNDSYALYSGTTNYVGQSFTTLDSPAILKSAKFYLNKSGSPTGNVYAQIWTHTGTFGTTSAPGTLLATSDLVSASGLSGSQTLTTFTFSGAEAITLAGSTNYVVVVKYTGGDISNSVVVGMDSSVKTATGNSSRSNDGISWTTSANDVAFYVYSGGDVAFNDDWGSTVPTGAAALQVAPHPSDKKEDILLFGNGRYAGAYFADSNTLDVDRLDFGQGVQVDDVIYNAGYWYIAVNSGITGNNRTEGQVYMYDGAAVTSTLTDETGVGMQRIGFLFRINGIVYVAYQDLSSAGFIIGYINGKSISPLCRFTGTLPDYRQKTLYKNTILFLSSGMAYSAGALIPELPYQLSQIADGGYATVGAIAAPFGVPMIASTNGTTGFRLAKFSGYDVNCSWRSIVFPTSLGKFKGMIDEIVVLTKPLGSGARCDMKIEANQGVDIEPTGKQIATTGKTRHYFANFDLPPGGIEDFRLALDWTFGSATNDCAIRKIIVNGHFVTNT